MECHELTVAEHRVLDHVTSNLRRKPNKARGVRMCQVQPNNIAEELGMKRMAVRQILLDLDDREFVSFFAQEDGTVGEGRRGCTCPEPALAWLVDRPRTSLGARSSGEGGQGEGARDRRSPSVRNAHGAELRHERFQTLLAKDPDALSANDLAFFFGYRVVERQLWASKVPGAVNHKALATNLARWIREGTKPGFIREMIEVFSKDRKFLAEGGIAWQVFINKRALLAQRAANRVKSRTDDLGWDDPLESDDTDLGWGDAEKYTNPEH